MIVTAARSILLAAAALALGSASLFPQPKPRCQADASLCVGDQVSGTVARVIDGDTLRLDQNYRLQAADAPESRPPPGIRHTPANRGGQPYGKEAKTELERLALGQHAELVVLDFDRYDRPVAWVTVNGLSVNAEMIRRGAAWLYRAYNDDPALIVLEDQARRERLGLWALPENERTAPWVWRACQTGRPAPAGATCPP